MTLGDLCEFENGDRSSNYPSGRDFSHSGIPFVNAGHVADGKINLGRMDFITSESYFRLTRGKVRSGDILYCLRGSVGKFGLVPEGFGQGAIASSLVIVRPKPTRLSREYLACYFGSSLCSQMIESWASGAAQPNLGVQDLARFRIPLPSSPYEQQTIATALTDADGLINSLEQLLTKKRQIKQGAMQELLTGRRRLPGFQGNWGEATFADVAFIDPENLSSGTPAGFSFNYIALEGVNQGRLDSFAELQFDSAPSRARRVLRDGDVLVSTVRPNLKSHLLLDTLLGNWIASTGFSVVRCKPKIACPGFLFALLFSEVVEQQIDALLTGSNYPAINGRDVANLAFTCPPFDEQVAIARALSDMDEEISALESRLTKVRALKQAMAQALLTGRIRLVQPNL
ncbi:restriction endonuclease subunit S [Hylemonella sp. W303a]|uniref:restriction endonuclease subunit S n=1 Tax=Hylemonella sp. W303a TaxID=3389873 RepID=UPI00396B0190